MLYSCHHRPPQPARRRLTLQLYASRTLQPHSTYLAADTHGGSLGAGGVLYGCHCQSCFGPRSSPVLTGSRAARAFIVGV